MSLSRRKLSKGFKEAAVRRPELRASISEVARAYEVNPNVLHRWQRELRDHRAKALSGNGKSRSRDSQIAELERKVGPQAMEIDFSRRACALASHVKWESNRGISVAGVSISGRSGVMNNSVADRRLPLGLFPGQPTPRPCTSCWTTRTRRPR